MKSIKDLEILDPGATSHLLVTTAPMKNITLASSPLNVKLLDGACVSSTHTCTLNLPQNPTRAREGHSIPGLSSHSLMSVVKLCNAGCEVTFKKIDCQVKHLGRIILKGSKCTRTGLWMIKLANTDKITPDSSNQHQVQRNTHIKPTTKHIINNVIPTSSKPILVIYHHQTLGYPPVPTIIKECRNNQLNTFPGFDASLILHHLPPSRATAKGHISRPKSAIKSTRNNRAEILDARLQADYMNPPQQIRNTNENELFVYASLKDNINGVMYSDLTRHLPVESYWGMKYIFIAYIYDENVILMRPMKNRTDACMVSVFKDIYEYLKERCL